MCVFVLHVFPLAQSLGSHSFSKLSTPVIRYHDPRSHQPTTVNPSVALGNHQIVTPPHLHMLAHPESDVPHNIQPPIDNRGPLPIYLHGSEVQEGTASIGGTPFYSVPYYVDMGQSSEATAAQGPVWLQCMTPSSGIPPPGEPRRGASLV
jgi:hypothetical protein